MILFSPAKINLGLQITDRRSDGFHNLRSVMYTVPLCDIIEIKESGHQKSKMDFSLSGIEFEHGKGVNLCIRAYELLSAKTAIPSVQIHLHKQIPVGAGLGGGSSNASITLMGLNSIAADPLPPGKLLEIAAVLGSDCPFFLHTGAMMMEGRGEILTPVKIDLGQFYLVLLFPGIHISTAEAYASISPAVPKEHLREVIREPVKLWRELIFNDFEKIVFPRYPQLKKIK
jgi:4-diphosphocytidyl-2-C-methyl-D-erythritol kinase